MVFLQFFSEVRTVKLYNCTCSSVGGQHLLTLLPPPLSLLFKLPELFWEHTHVVYPCVLGVNVFFNKHTDRHSDFRPGALKCLDCEWSLVMQYFKAVC